MKLKKVESKKSSLINDVISRFSNAFMQFNIFGIFNGRTPFVAGLTATKRIAISRFTQYFAIESGRPIFIAFPVHKVSWDSFTLYLPRGPSFNTNRLLCLPSIKPRDGHKFCMRWKGLGDFLSSLQIFLSNERSVLSSVWIIIVEEYFSSFCYYVILKEGIAGNVVECTSFLIKNRCTLGYHPTCNH